MRAILSHLQPPPAKVKLPINLNTGHRIAPPMLVNPRVLKLTDALVWSRNGQIDLYGKGADWIIELPKDGPITRDLILHGRDQARHIVIIGGQLQAAQRFNTSTMQLLDGTGLALYTQCGFTGAIGGTFRVQLAESSYIKDVPPPYSADIPWDANAATVKAAIVAALGDDAVFDVLPVSTDTPGGPWRFIPGLNAKMGRVSLDISSLAGGAALTTRSNIYKCAYEGLTVKNFSGTAHIEGVRTGGSWSSDGFRVQCGTDEAVVQYIGCHSDAAFYVHHNDWSHPDGAQCYLGPTTLYAENCNFISHGGNGFIAQPRVTAGLGGLRDWWFKDCLFRAVVADRTIDYSTAFYQSDGYPVWENGANWKLQMQGCYASRRLLGSDVEITNDPDLKYFNHGPHSAPAGLTLRASPASSEFQTEAGLLYSQRGYLHIIGSPVMTKRLQGETLLT